MKVLRKIFFYLIITCLTLLTALVVSVWLYQDKIIAHFVREANKSLNTPINVEKFYVSVFDDFPTVSILLKNVYVEDSHPGKYPLLEASSVAFSFNMLELIKGNYIIRGLQVNEAQLNLRINEQGDGNYNILKETEEAKNTTLSFDLHNIRLVDFAVLYKSIPAKQEHLFETARMQASIKYNDKMYDIKANGDVLSKYIRLDKSVFLENKLFDAAAFLSYDDAENMLYISPSKLLTGQAQFEVYGDYRLKEQLINIHTEGKNTNIQTLLALFPDHVADRFEKYKSSGLVYFDLKLAGEISDKKSPELSISFGLEQASIFNPEYKSKIDEATLEGLFKTKSLSDFRNAELELRNIKGKLNNNPYQASFYLKNFDDPFVRLSFKGLLDGSAIQGFYEMPQVKKLSGKINADIAFEGRTALLKNRNTAQQVSTKGNIELNQVNIETTTVALPFENLNGSLQFNKNDLALSNVSGRFGNSDFLINGFFKNIITFLLFENQQVGIEADLKSKFIDIDELLSSSASFISNKQAYHFSIPENIILNFNCDVRSVKFRRFHGRSVKGDLLVKDKIAVSKKISMQSMGGPITLSGIIDARKPKAIDVMSTFNISNVHLDSIFYVFENFSQTWLQDRHLKGLVTAEVNTEMTLSDELTLFQNTLIADINATIRNGELNDFEPMKQLSKYLDEDNLHRLRFAELKNEIHIENRVIYLPQMQVGSNVSDIKISGTHTFDQVIDYRIVAPLRSKKKIDPDEAFGAIEDDGSGRSMLHMKIIGTTNNFTVSLDTDAVKKKIASDIKKEFQELRDAFKLKGNKKKKELELVADDYFDWEENN
ncbi:MAG TPA: AsmA-like C-terminal region-containing protein [Cyclobacteriaceae bacterium]|nr:AsmA-like C-terminal region-containing protein [Cyclobacteriaceae bacterium]